MSALHHLTKRGGLPSSWVILQLVFAGDVGVNQGSADADVNEDRALMRFEMLEAFLRMAITMRDNEGQFDTSPAEKVRLRRLYVAILIHLL